MDYQDLLERLKEDLPKQQASFFPDMPDLLFWALCIAVVLGAIFTLWLFVGPVYEVWASKKRGEASLAEANFAEQVAIAQATARFNAAELNKKAEVVEAEAVSISISKIGDALQKNEGYLRWQWIKNMAETENEVIYIPTEAGLPILEAGKRINKLPND